MKEFESQFNAITPEIPESKKKPEADSAVSEGIKKPTEEKLIPLQETEESVFFLGVETSKGKGGPKTPPLERFQKDVVTNFDHKLMRDIAVAFRTKQPVMLQGGSGIGKSRTVDRMCGLLNREVYYADCHQFDADTLIGKMAPSEETKTGFGWRDGVVIQAIRNGGILFLDEYNFMSGEVRASLHEILDAILQGKNEITLVDNHGERVPVHPDFQIVAAQNPPGGEHGNREVLDPAQYTRFSHLNLPEDLPKEVKKARALGRFGFDNKITLGQSEYLYSGGVSQEALAEIPGLETMIEKYIEFSESLEKVIEAGDLKDGPQPIYFAFQRDYDRVMSFVEKFYQGDINKTFAQALRNNYVNRFIDPANRATVEEMIRRVRYEPPQDNRRKGLEREKKPEVGMSPEDLERQKKAEEMLAKSDKELAGLKAALESKKKELGMESISSPEAILKIDRSADVIKFTGWDGAKIEDKDTDTRSIALKEIDLSKLKLDTSWLGGKSSLNGEKRLEALKTGSGIRLDAQILMTLRNLPKEELDKKIEIIAEANKVSIEDLKKKAIFFDGTIIRDSDGLRRELCLCWGGSEWSWNDRSLGNDWLGNYPSLVLAPSSRT